MSPLIHSLIADTLNASVDNLVASPENVELIPNDTDNESLEMDSSNDNRHSFIRGEPDGSESSWDLDIPGGLNNTPATQTPTISSPLVNHACFETHLQTVEEIDDKLCKAESLMEKRLKRQEVELMVIDRQMKQLKEDEESLEHLKSSLLAIT